MKMRTFGLITVAFVLAVVGITALARDPVEGDVTPANASYFVLPAVPITVTNGQVLTVAASHYKVTVNLGAVPAGDIATNTLVAPTAAQEGMIVIFNEALASTGRWCVVDASPCNLAGNYTSSSNDTSLVLMAQDLKWVEQKWSLTSATTMTIAGNTTVGGFGRFGGAITGLTVYATGVSGVTGNFQTSTALTYQANTVTGAAMVGGTAAIAGASTSLTSVVNLQTVNDWLNVGGSATGATLAATAYWTGIMTNQIQGVGTQKTTIVFGQVKTNVWVGL